MTTAQLATLLVAAYGPTLAHAVAEARRTTWAAHYNAATDPERRARIAGHLTYWRTVATRLRTHHPIGSVA